MRWDDLFADLEAQVDQAVAAELDLEVADRSRRELAAITLLDRAGAYRGAVVQVGIRGHGAVEGVLADAAEQWLMVEESGGREVLVPLGGCLWLRGLGRAAEVPAEHSLARRLGLGPALRSLARARIPVVLGLADGSQVDGTVDRVHADHLDLAEHPRDELRRRAAVRGVRTIPFAALVLVRPAAAGPG
jgi:hypothetical protein